MIKVEELSPKFSHTYRCVDDLRNLTLRVRLICSSKSEEDDVKTFKWQEECPNQCESVNEPQKSASRRRKKSSASSQTRGEGSPIGKTSKLFTCTGPEAEDLEKENFGSDLGKLMEKLKLEPKIEKISENSEYNYENHLNSCLKSPELDNQYEIMHILADFGDFYKSTWIKSEYILCTLKYDKRGETLTVHPDFTTSAPYKLQINSEETYFAEYYIENASLDQFSAEDLSREAQILKTLLKSKESDIMKKIGGLSAVPDEKSSDFFVFFDVQTGSNFENDNCFIKYQIELPNKDEWKCLNEDCLTGNTICCRKWGKNAHFSTPFEIHLRKTGKNDHYEHPVMFFEVISKDSWSRFRSEGLGHFVLPLNQRGPSVHQIQCFRLMKRGLESQLRRYFIGDSSNYTDLSALKPKERKIINRLNLETVSTGRLTLSLNILRQNYIDNGLDERERKLKLMEKFNGTDVLTKSVDHVLESFERARKAMQEARKLVES